MPIDSSKRELETVRNELAQAVQALSDAREVIDAIRSGAVDALIVPGPDGDQVFTLNGSEYAYRALVESMSEGAATLDANGRVLYCNQRLAILLGIPLEQIVGNSVSTLVADHSGHTLRALCRRALARDTVRLELDLHLIDGRRTPVFISFERMEDCGPMVLCMVITDLAELKKKDELVAAGALAAAILENAAEAIAVCDDTGRIITANRVFESLCGFDPALEPFDQALPLQVAADEFGPARPFSIFSPLAGEVYRTRAVTFRHAKRTLTLLLSSGRISGASGVVGCVLTLTDITERETMGEKLRDSERLYRAIGESANYGVWVCSPEGRNVYASESFLQLVGMTQQQYSDLGWQGVLHPDDAERASTEWKEFRDRQRGRAWDIEQRFRGADGQWHPILVRGIPVFDDNGKIKCWAGLHIDISKLKDAEQAMIRSEKLAALGRLSATVAHEINNPLSSVMNVLYLIDGGSLSAQSRQLLESAEVELSRVAKICSTTLGLARKAAPKSHFRPAEVLDGVLALLPHKAFGKTITYSKQVREEQLEMVGSADEIRQVLWNLLSNAADAIPAQGHVVVRILSSRSPHAPFVPGIRITVADDGCGMTRETRQRIFEPFFTSKDSGTGLGLPVAMDIVRKHAGSIKVRSRTGETKHGTVFSIFIPHIASSDERSEMLAETN